jgi:hypothetical protein
MFSQLGVGFNRMGLSVLLYHSPEEVLVSMLNVKYRKKCEKLDLRCSVAGVAIDEKQNLYL